MVRTDTKEPVSVGQRLRRARADLGLRQVEMARAVGVTQSSIAAYETDRRQPPLPVALAFEHVFRISHRWLLHAQGERLVRAGPLRPAILACARERRALEDGTDADRYIAVPCLRDPADAGAETITTEQIEEYCLMRQRVAPHPQRVRCLRIRGDAMAPTLPEGSTVAVDTTPVPLRNLEGRVVCARTRRPSSSAASACATPTPCSSPKTPTSRPTRPSSSTSATGRTPSSVRSPGPGSTCGSAVRCNRDVALQTHPERVAPGVPRGAVRVRHGRPHDLPAALMPPATARPPRRPCRSSPVRPGGPTR